MEVVVDPVGTVDVCSRALRQPSQWSCPPICLVSMPCCLFICSGNHPRLHRGDHGESHLLHLPSSDL